MPLYANDGQTFQGQPAHVQATFRAVYGDQAEARWVAEHNAEIAAAAPPATATPTAGTRWGPGGPPPAATRSSTQIATPAATPENRASAAPPPPAAAPPPRAAAPPPPAAAPPPPATGGATNITVNYPGPEPIGTAPAAYRLPNGGTVPVGTGIEWARFALATATLASEHDYREALVRTQNAQIAQQAADNAAQRALTEMLQQRGMDIQQFAAETNRLIQTGQLDLAREQQRFQQMNENEKLALTRTLGLEDLAIRRQQLNQQLQIATDENEIRRAQLALQTQIQTGQLALSQRELDVREQQGLGQLQLGREQLATQRELGLGDLQLRRDQLDLQRQLGLATVETERERLALDAEIRRRQTALQEQIEPGRLALEQELGRGQLGISQREQALRERQFAASLRGPGDAFTALRVLRGQQPGSAEQLPFLQSVYQNKPLASFQGQTPGARVPTAAEVYGGPFTQAEVPQVTAPGQPPPGFTQVGGLPFYVNAQKTQLWVPESYTGAQPVGLGG